jgi:hypothetical protein
MSKNLNKQKRKMFEPFIVQPMNIDSTWHGWMNLCVSTTSIRWHNFLVYIWWRLDTPIAPSCSQQKKTPRPKMFKPFIKQLEIWEVSFQCWLVLGFWDELPVLVPKNFKGPNPVQFRFILRNWNLVLVSILVLKPSFKLVCFWLLVL